MSFATVTRRGFLKGACMLSGGILLGIRMTGKAAAISASRSAINRKNCCIPNGLTNPARSRS